MFQKGRGSTLTMEEGFHYSARLYESGLHLSPDVIDDAVGEVIEKVMTKGGNVMFVDDCTLTQYQSIALILRY